MSVFSDAAHGDGDAYPSRGRGSSKASRCEGDPSEPLLAVGSPTNGGGTDEGMFSGLKHMTENIRERGTSLLFGGVHGEVSAQDIEDGGGDMGRCSNTHTTNPKSLFFCLAVDNPFDPNDEFRNRTISEDEWKGNEETDENPSTFLSDEDFLLQFSRSKPRAPTQFQKVIEILFRLKIRNVEFEPVNMLERVPLAEVETARKLPNYFHGFRLNEESLLKSPDEDEIYIKIHCKKSTLLHFAQKQGHQLGTNPFGCAGGAGMVYEDKMEKEIGESVEKYIRCYGEDQVPDRFKGKKGSRPWGFKCEVPQKMRLTVKLLREAWAYGGCGIPVEDMKKREILVRHFFPLHNLAYLTSHGIAEWATFKALTHANPLRQNDEALVLYFGERVALYFVWLKCYSFSLIVPAICGVCAGISMSLHFRTSLVNAVFSLVVVLWAVTWGRYWAGKEAKFVCDNQQKTARTQEMVRDQFTPDTVRDVKVSTIYQCEFEYPLTLRRRPDGTMVELRYSPLKRKLIRCFITYPLVLVLTGVMLVALVFVTKWRFENIENIYVTYASSILAVVISVVFGKVFSVFVDKLNELENNRTDSEEERQFILKSFLFYFWSSYFALFAIALYPDCEGCPQTTKIQRLQQLNAQMLVICVVQPAFQNIQELLMPKLLNQFRRRRDKSGSACGAICSMLCCKSMKSPPIGSAKEAECKRLWRTTQREPYDSPAEDFLEITIQFGYMAMFAAVFPWGPLAALFYNIIEIRVDAKKLLFHCQRPMARSSAGIGAWRSIFWILTGMSVVTNSYLITVLSPAASKLDLSNTETDRYVYFTILQYALVIVITVIYLSSNAEPTSVKRVWAKQRLLGDVAIKRKLMHLLDHGGGDSELVTDKDELDKIV